MWPHRTTYDIEGILGMTTPVANGLATSIAQRHITGTYRMYLSAQHLHTFHIGMLALHIGGPHKDFTFHIHQGAHGGRSHAMLSGSGLGDDACLAHLLGHQNLTHGIIDLMSTRMVQVFTLQIQLTAISIAHTLSIIKWRRATYIVA